MTAALEGGEWSAARSGRTLPRKKPGTHFQEAGWAPGPVWTGRIYRFHWYSIPDRPTHSQSLYRLSYRAHTSRCIAVFFFFVIQDSSVDTDDRDVC